MTNGCNENKNISETYSMKEYICIMMGAFWLRPLSRYLFLRIYFGEDLPSLNLKFTMLHHTFWIDSPTRYMDSSFGLGFLWITSYALCLGIILWTWFDLTWWLIEDYIWTWWLNFNFMIDTNDISWVLFHELTLLEWIVFELMWSCFPQDCNLWMSLMSLCIFNFIFSFHHLYLSLLAFIHDLLLIFLLYKDSKGWWRRRCLMTKGNSKSFQNTLMTL